MGCRVCRARKVKCDERPHGCLNCERLELNCVGLEVASPSVVGGSLQSPDVPTAIRKKRTYRSCISCRAAKTKCDGNRPACFRCKARSNPCVYNAGSKPFWAQVLSKSETGGRKEPRLPSETTFSAVSEHHEERQQYSTDLREQENDRRSTAVLLSSPPTQLNTDSASPDPIPDQRIPDTESWLLSPQLPSALSLLRQLVEQYFSNVHHLRCFAFIHKPSFMRQLDLGFDSNSDENALLHIICAHGAKFYALEHSRDVEPLPAKLMQLAGNEWAKTAERLILANYGKISIPNLKTAVLLYDYEFRMGNYAHTLMLSGFTTRMAHALQLNLECSADGGGAAPSITDKETRRRLMWACYVLDAWTGSGVDQLTLIHEGDIKIQLPCNERNFLLQIPCTTQKLDYNQITPGIDDNLGMMSSYIRLVALWKRVVRYVKHLDAAQPPWVPNSEFLLLDADLRAWRSGLAPCLDFSPESIYTRLESSQFGALALLHCTYHNAMCDLHRISMPELFKLRDAFDFPPAQTSFLKNLKTECFHHALSMAIVLAETVSRGPRFLADSMLPVFTYNSSRIMLYYVARLLDRNQPHTKAIVDNAIKYVQSNNKALRMMSGMIPLASPVDITTERWLRKVRTSFTKADATAHIGPPDPSDIHETKWTGSTSDSQLQDTPDNVLNPLSLYRLARKAVCEKHSSEHFTGSFHSGQISSPLTGANTIPGESGRQQYHSSQRDGTGTRFWSPAPMQDSWLTSVEIDAPEDAAGSLLTEIIAGNEGELNLHDLQYCPPWDLDGIFYPNDTGMEESRLTA